MQTAEEKKLIEHVRFRPSIYLGILGNGGFSTNRMYRLLQEVLNYIALMNIGRGMVMS